MSDIAKRIGIPAGVAEDVRGGTFNAQLPAVREAILFLDAKDRRRILILAGPPGTGKSAAAAHAVLGARTADRVYRFHDQRDDSLGEVRVPGSALEAARWIQATAFWSGVYDRPLLEAARHAPVLVVDDLGAEPPDDRATPLIASIVAERVDAAMKTLVTTNMDPRLFENRYGRRVVDRLVGNAWFGTRGPSLRGGGA